MGSRIHGAIPSIIHGASAHIIYTDKKAEVIENSINILADYIQTIQQNINISYFGKERINLEEFGDSIDKESLKMAIDKEKEKIHYILKRQTILKNYIL
mgnify:CR=1 FL=1